MNKWISGYSFIFAPHTNQSLSLYMEQLLHYVWKHKLFPLGEMKTTKGLPVEVIDTGLHNSNAGPDFFNAKLKIDGTLWVGNVEIHSASSDWLRHGHQSDVAYDSVILHVVGCLDSETTRTNGETIPQMLLSCPDHVRRHYRELSQAEISPACYSIISSLPKLTVNSWLTALQTERFEQKTNAIRHRVEQCGRNWEDAFFITLARYAGVGINGDAFETWAMKIPYRAVDKMRDDRFRIESLFMGMAGFLAGEVKDEMMQRMQKEFHYQSQLYQLPAPMEPSRWKFLRLRPDNFPYIRISQLAGLYHTSTALFSKLMAAECIEEIRELLQTDVSDYWKAHFCFAKPSPVKEKKWGRMLQDILIINAVVPFLYAYGLHRGEEILCARAQRFLEELKAENNFVTRLWDQAGIPVKHAADSQALLQLHRAYCEPRKCLFCRFGYEYLRKAGR